MRRKPVQNTTSKETLSVLSGSPFPKEFADLLSVG